MSLFRAIQDTFSNKLSDSKASPIPPKKEPKLETVFCRSLLFVPGNRPERFDKAATSGADAIIIDLEDSVPAEHKEKSREAVRNYLQSSSPIKILVRINPLDSEYAIKDIKAILDPKLPFLPDGIVLPKAEGAATVKRLISLMGEVRVPILPISTETAGSIFEIGSFRKVSKYLMGLTWGAEDLPASIGAETSRHRDGYFTPPYEMVRNLALFGAHAAKVQAIETVYPNIRDLDGLTEYAARGLRDGFTGMMALHPDQVMIINAAFSPSEDSVEHARAVIAAFAANPGAGVLELDGKMIDKPHLIQARKIVAAAAKSV